MDEGLEAIVKGKVQGVGFRAFVVMEAVLLGLKGYAKNLYDGTVEVVAEGKREQLEKLLAALRKGTPLSLVESVKASFSKASGGFRGFSIKYYNKQGK